MLLTAGLRRLLDTAGDAAKPEPWPRVHALNMLRLAFSERDLAVDGSAYLAEGADSSPPSQCSFCVLAA